MVKKDLVDVRLEKLRLYLKTLKAIGKYDLKMFKNDVFIHATAERYLHLSIECLLDMGNHIISDKGYRKPETYTEIFRILKEEKVISAKLLEELEGMAAFRNILVHDYLKIDLDKIHIIIREKINAMEKMATVYAKLI